MDTAHNSFVGRNFIDADIQIGGALAASLTQANKSCVVNFDSNTNELTYKRYVYGSFISTASQSLNQTSANLITINQTGGSTSGLTLASNKITFTQTGNYRVGVSILFTKSIGGDDTASFWFRKNGNNIDNSMTRVFLTGNGHTFTSYAEIIDTFNLNDYIEVYAYTPSTNVSIQYIPASPPFPAGPGIILTIDQVS